MVVGVKDSMVLGLVMMMIEWVSVANTAVRVGKRLISIKMMVNMNIKVQGWWCGSLNMVGMFDGGCLC